MRSLFPGLPLIAAGLVFGCLASTSALAEDAEMRLADTIERIEQAHGARVGLMIRDSASDWQWGHRTDERFLMASTFKAMLCGAVLDRVDEGTLSLGEPLEIRQEDILEYAPVTETKVGETMPVGELCLAAIDMSDNTATNILIDHLGGPQEVTSFLQGIGDEVSRLDRREPELNTFAPGDPRDTSTPEAMVTTLDKMLLGDALSTKSRARLVDWMSPGGVTGGLLRASAPDGWLVADKSGSGAYNRNLVGMVTPTDGTSYLFAIFLSDTNVDFETRNAALIELSAAVVEVIKTR